MKSGCELAAFAWRPSFTMTSIQEVTPAIQACLKNAEKLIEAAKATSKPGSYHIAYHLAALALEEIGKSSMVFLSAINPRQTEEGEQVGSIKWIDDHERKLFWAIWLPRHENLRDWKTIPESLEIARRIHEKRLESLYVDPASSGLAGISGEQANGLISLADARLNMERLKGFEELDDVRKAELQWFFAAIDNPELRRMIFSKGSLDKQTEFGADFGGWMKWLHEQFDEAARQSIELTNQEMRRVPPKGEAGWKDKFEIRIRLRSWSHSIRANQLKDWNAGIEKIKLATTNDRNELMVTMTVPLRVQALDIWNMAFQQAFVFVTAMNIGTTGFFWWYLPQFVSSFFEKIRDIEHDADIDVRRTPELRLSWGHLALKSSDLNNVGIIIPWIARSNQEQIEPFQRYFRALALMAKNDIFFQFEPNIVTEFVGALKDAMRSNGDWDGKEETYEAAIDALFKPVSTEFVQTVKEQVAFARQIETNKRSLRPVSLEDVGKAKIIFDVYIKLKANAHLQEQIQKATAQPAVTVSGTVMG
jgi:AbiV family abortive infection protein